jgi:hypothetical protein
MAEHLTDGGMLIGQFLDPVEVGVQPQTERA